VPDEQLIPIEYVVSVSR